jgi:hypothetical protein
MKKLFLGILVIGSLSTQASMLEVNGPLDAKLFEAQVNDEKTYFETLGDLFKVGTIPNLSKISNIAWAGRCFLKGKPNEPTNAGYIFRKKTPSDVGPIGASTQSYESLSYWTPNMAPNFYDNLNLEQVYALIPRVSFFDAKIMRDSIQVDMDATTRSNLKVSGSYLVEEITAPASDSGPIGNVSVALRCYYFIPDLNLSLK